MSRMKHKHDVDEPFLSTFCMFPIVSFLRQNVRHGGVLKTMFFGVLVKPYCLGYIHYVLSERDMNIAFQNRTKNLIKIDGWLSFGA